MNSMHNEIKTYSLTDSDGQAVHFKIQSMESIEERMAGIHDSPHRHDYYTVILVHEAKGTHYVDFQSYNLQGNTIYFINPGQVHQVISDGNAKGWVLTFTQEFLMQNSISEQLINDVYLYNDYGESPPLTLHQEETDALTAIVHQLNEYNTLASTYKNEAIGSLLKLLFIKSNNLCVLSKELEAPMQETGNALFRNFKTLINQHYTDKHNGICCLVSGKQRLFKQSSKKPYRKISQRLYSK